MNYQPYPEYKGSGVEWLGDIPEHWNAHQLKFSCTYNDEVLADSINDDYEIEYVDIGSVSASEGISKTEKMRLKSAPSRAKRIVRDGDVIVSTVRTYLEAIAPIDNPPDNLIVSTGFAVIRPNKYLHKGFAAYCLRASGFIKEVVAQSVGISYPAINASDLVNIKTPKPKFDEQKKIAKFLDHETAEIDTLIEKQQQLIKLLKEKRQAVISHAVTKGLNPNAPMRDSGIPWLGKVPEHWVATPIKLVISTRKGVAFKSTDFCDHGARVVKASDIKWKTIKASDVFLPESFVSEYPKAVLNAGDIILSTVGSNPNVINSAVGQIGMVPDELSGSLLNQNTVVYDPNETKILREYLFFVLQMDAYREHLDLNAHGTANQSSLSIADMLNFNISIPPMNEQLKICAALSQQQENLQRLVLSSKESEALLKERRTALISAAVTGKIDVRNNKYCQQ